MSGDRLPTVLLYHQLQQTPTERTSVTPEAFRSQLLALRQDGWHFVPLATLLPAVLRGGYGRTGLPWLAVTFDDGYADFAGMKEFLADNDVPATVFLLTQSVGSTNLWNPKAHTIAEHLSLADVKELARAGVDFQLHGTDHHRLTKFDRAALEERFRRGCGWFEEVLGRRPSVLAYPYGSFDATVRQTAARYFEYATSVSQGCWGGEESRYALNRLEIQTWMTPAFLARLLSAPRRQRGRMLCQAREEAGA